MQLELKLEAEEEDGKAVEAEEEEEEGKAVVRDWRWPPEDTRMKIKPFAIDFITGSGSKYKGDTFAFPSSSSATAAANRFNSGVEG